MANQYVDELNIKCNSILQPVRSLSGGNQQKVALGKWLASDAEVFPDIFTHEESGLLYSYPDLAGCLEGLVSLMEDDGKRERMARAALERAQDFRAERITGMYASLYREFLPGEAE